MPTLTFYQDPGHGWIQVPKALLHQAMPITAISRFSYQDRHHYYLEEDCDMPAFLHAAKAAGLDIAIREHVTNYESHIRTFASANPHAVWRGTSSAPAPAGGADPT